MELVKRSELVPEPALLVNEINIQNGSGKFLVEGGFQKEKTITVHYHKPSKLTPESPVILVLPGAGRNGDDYRDAWVEKSEKYNILVLSLEYSQKHYLGFPGYNMAGMITNVQMNEERTAVTQYELSGNPKEWIYNDFDRIFNLVRSQLKMHTNSYDMFGHSAGGQVAHRLTIFKPDNKANRIVASNSGWYTLPLDTIVFPYGLKDSPRISKKVDFTTSLILFLGEDDDANETRGDLRRSPEVYIQGLHRLARGKYFYHKSKEIALEMNADFNWGLEIIPDVGHDYKEMSKAAADFLYKLK
jgi:pimeloyl-ACP methyl ester carboxylesterase